MPSEHGEEALFRLLMARITSSDEINIALSGNITLAGKQAGKTPLSYANTELKYSSKILAICLLSVMILFPLFTTFTEIA